MSAVFEAGVNITIQWSDGHMAVFPILDRQMYGAEPWVRMSCRATAYLWSHWRGVCLKNGGPCQSWPISGQSPVSSITTPCVGYNRLSFYYYNYRTYLDDASNTDAVWFPESALTTILNYKHSDKSRYPHSCTFCGAPAYIGATPASLDCSNKCRP